MRKMMACMLGAALCFSMAGAETGVSSAEKASPLFGRMIWNRGWEFRLEDEPISRLSYYKAFITFY